MTNVVFQASQIPSDLTDPRFYIDLASFAYPDWAASTAYTLNVVRRPPVRNGFAYQCTTAGTSSGTEPTWPTTLGATVNDGTAVWTCIESFWADVDEGGPNIRVYLDDGTTEIARDAASCKKATETGGLWIKIPGTVSSSVNTPIQVKAIASAVEPVSGEPGFSEDVWSGFGTASHDGGITDASGNTSPINNGATPDVAAKLGTGASFPGSGSNRVTVPSTADISDVFHNGGTFIGWLQVDSDGGGGSGRVFDKRSSGNNDGIALWARPSDELRFVQDFSSSEGRWDFPMSFGALHHLVIVYDASDTANDPVCYVDGVAVTVTETVTPSGTVDSDAGNNLYFGNRQDSFNRALDGILDELRFIKTPLTADEVTAIFNNQSSPSTFYEVGGGETPVAGSVWVGHVTDTAITLSAKVENKPDAKLIVSENSDFSGSNIESATLTADSFGLIGATLTGLTADTVYYVALEHNSVRATANFGRFKTLPGSAVLSESIAFASCGASGTDARIFDTIADKADSDELSVFFHMGDLHYEDIATNDETLYQDAYDAVFASARQSRIFRRMPLYYMWDDHDYGPNDSDSTSASRPAAVTAYRRRVPTPTLAQSGAADAVYYSFVRGRVRYLMTDLRSERSPKGNTDNASKIVMSATQLQWFKDECLAAKAAGQVIAWMSSYSFSQPATVGSDRWGGYTTQRQEILDFWAANDLDRRVFVFSGDYHFLAYDDGTNAPGGINLMQAGPLDSTHGPSTETYTVGRIQDSQSQYGQLDITDTGGDTISFRFRGWAVNQTTGVETQVIDQSFSVTASPGPFQLGLTATGIPDGTYPVRIYDHLTGALVEEVSLAFASGAATHELLYAIGTEFDAYVMDNNDPPQEGALMYAVVADAA